jgi:hypothetical protein
MWRSNNTNNGSEEAPYYYMMEPWPIAYCMISYNILVTHFKGYAWEKFSNKVKVKVKVRQNEEFSMMKKSVT